MRLERSLAGMAVVVVGAALFTGFPAAGDIFGTPIAAQFVLPDADPIPDGTTPTSPRSGFSLSPGKGDPGQAFVARDLTEVEQYEDPGNPGASSPGSVPGTVTTGGAGVPLELPDPDLAPDEAALRWLERQHAPFGLRTPRKDLRVASLVKHGDDGSVVTFRQVLGRLPVLGSSVTVNLDADLAVTSATGNTSHAENDAASGAVLSAKQAKEVALDRVAALISVPADQLTPSTPDIWLADPALGADFSGAARPVWQLTVTAPGGGPLTVLVDARSGEALTPQAPSQPEPEPEPEPTPPVTEPTDPATEEPTAPESTSSATPEVQLTDLQASSVEASSAEAPAADGTSTTSLP